MKGGLIPKSLLRRSTIVGQRFKHVEFVQVFWFLKSWTRRITQIHPLLLQAMKNGRAVMWTFWSNRSLFCGRLRKMRCGYQTASWLLLSNKFLLWDEFQWQSQWPFGSLCATGLISFTASSYPKLSSTQMVVMLAWWNAMSMMWFYHDSIFCQRGSLEVGS